MFSLFLAIQGVYPIINISLIASFQRQSTSSDERGVDSDEEEVRILLLF